MNVKLQRPYFSRPVKATKVAMLTRIEELEQEATLNASMLARQTDLAREAEVKLAEKDARFLRATLLLKAAHEPHQYDTHPMLGGHEMLCLGCGHDGPTGEFVLVKMEDCPQYQREQLKQQLAKTDIALKEAKADAESWYEQTEAARDALIRNGRESDAALGTLAETLEHIAEYWNGLPNERALLDAVQEMTEAAREALASDFVQQAIAAWKAKDAEIERLKPSYICAECSFSIIPNGVGTSFKCGNCGAISVGEMLWRTVSLLQLKGVLIGHAQEANEVEAKLAVATGLLGDIQGLVEILGKPTTWENNTSSVAVSVMSAAKHLKERIEGIDSSRAAEQYREALSIRERVKAEIVLVESASRYLAGEPAPIRFFAKKLKALLGDAAQEEQ